eukprot:TRINITY_DN3121_c0_g2_i1.p1 TRINITY_DN3121_c0_g2~~TRINITY_DN3121_c0_g2_i1.p1  ORF type:complete len:281 (+),score=56.39 TRINITY_DN3121_c0_g2_i1:89-844(+)
MTTVAAEYDAFAATLRDAEEALRIFKEESHGPKHKECCLDVRKAIKACNQALKMAELAIPEIQNTAERAVWRRKVAGAHKEIRAIERDMTTLDSTRAKKSTLFSGMKDHLDVGEDLEMGEEEDLTPSRKKSIETNKLLRNQNKSVERSEQIAIESERLGQDTVHHLRRQRETMMHTIDTTQEISENMTRSKVLVTTLKRAFVYNRLMQILIIIALLTIICLIIYFKWLQSDSPQVVVVPGTAPPVPSPPQE